MLAHFDGLADDLARCAKNAATDSREKLDHENENSIVVRYLQSFEREVTEYGRSNPFNLDIDTYKLNDQGPNTPEKRFGADYAIGYTFQLSNLDLSKGILVQAKKRRYGQSVKLDDVRGQCNKMLRWTPDSFINMISNRNFRIHPALQIAKTQGNVPRYSGSELEFDRAFNYRTALQFYRLFFEGYVGDNWVFENINHLTMPNDYPIVERPFVPDGGAPSEENGQGRGVKALIIAVAESGEQVELPFTRDDTVDTYKTGISELDW